MKPWVLTALAAACVAGLVSALPERTEAPSGSESAPPPLPPSECPKGSLPDHGVCIPVPEPEPGPSEALAEKDARIPRRPDRPADYAAYSLPVAIGGRSSAVLEDLSAIPQEALGGGVAPGPSGVLIEGAVGAAVQLVGLENQSHDATAIYTGELIGPTAVTLHRTKSHDRSRDYLLVFGNLEQPPEWKAGAPLARDAMVGKIGSALTSESPALYFEARLLRPGVDAKTLAAPEILDPAYTVSVDARNVFSLLPGARAAP